MEKIVVLGGYGEMGRIISIDLAETADKFRIVIAGRDGKKAEAFAKSFNKPNIIGVGADLNNHKQMKQVLEGAKVLINATNYYFNVQVMKTALKAHVNYIDLGGLYHTTLKQLRLHDKFKKAKIIALLGCGSTPGITNIMAHYGAEKLDRIHEIHIQFADKDYTNYNMPFVVPYSMQTVFDEFTKRPAVFTNGKMTFADPLGGGINVTFPQPVGKVLCRYSLHSELASLPKHFASRGIKECSFRGGWDPDFVNKTSFLIQAGFASETPIIVKGNKVVPRDVAVALLNRFLPPESVKVNDVEFLRVELKGTRKKKEQTLVVYCKAVSNKKWNIPAGSWDTGVPLSIVAQMIATGHISGGGVYPSDARNINPKKFFKELKKRNMKVFIAKR